MNKLSIQIPSAKRGRLTHLKSRKANQKGWSSTFLILKRYNEIKTFLLKLDLQELMDHFLYEVEDRTIEHIFHKLIYLDSVTRERAGDGVTMSDARALLDAVIQINGSTQTWLGTLDRIVQKATFDYVIVRIQNNEEAKLTGAEETTGRNFREEPSSATSINDDSESLLFVQRVLKKR